MKRVIFVSKLNSLNSNASSTDITTNNIIEGLHDLKTEIIFIVFGNDINDNYQNDIIKSYSNKISKFIFLKCPIGNIKNKYNSLLKTLKYYFKKNYYHNFISSIKDIIDNNTVLISHSPSIETILLCREIKKIYNIKWIEYWSDPYTLNAINPEDYNFKRLIFKWLENKFLSYCDEVVYAPKTLYEFQKKFLPKHSYKMRFVEASYCNNYINDTEKLQSNLFIYAGNYYSKIRNIKPLFEAFSELKEYELDVYGNGDVSYSSNNINIKGRISPNELKTIESKYQNIICIMNSNCIQIPGKIFYRMSCNQNIFVICDGIHQDELIKYLKSFNRFIIVKNNKESIINGIKNINKKIFDTKKIQQDYSPKKIAYDILNNNK